MRDLAHELLVLVKHVYFGVEDIAARSIREGNCFWKSSGWQGRAYDVDEM